MNTKLKVKITAANPALEDRLYSLEELAAKLGFPFIAVKATQVEELQHPVGTTLMFVGRNADKDFVPAEGVPIDAKYTNTRYWKKFKDE